MKKVLVIFLIFISGCVKEHNMKHDWQIFDVLGNELGREFNKTESDMANKYPNPCTYFKIGEKKFCWKNGNNYQKDYSEKFAGCFFPSYVKVDCDMICEKWYIRNRTTDKSTGSFSYSNLTVRDYCPKDPIDSITILNNGGPIIVENSSTFLIVLQRSRDGVTFF
ncbi:MAG: hypothetical protein V4556_08300 [Bacteroidota bacterium]